MNQNFDSVSGLKDKRYLFSTTNFMTLSLICLIKSLTPIIQFFQERERGAKHKQNQSHGSWCYIHLSYTYWIKWINVSNLFQNAMCTET